MHTHLSQPLALSPRYRARVWGGHAFTSHFGRQLPAGLLAGKDPVGESWELCDFPVGNPDDESARTAVFGGLHDGRTLQELRHAYGKELMGDLRVNPATNGFPLLLKYLDASAALSVQVHPSPAYAAAHPQAHLKSEAWFIVDCKPGAVIHKGLKPGVGAADLRKALALNRDDAVVPLMQTVPVAPGDCHHLPSGTCHALGAGILVAEIQTPSDTTFRVYDWGRVGRQLHVEQALACIDFSGQPLPPATRAATGPGRTTMVDCEFFRTFHVRLAAGEALAAPDDRRPVAWMVIAGEMTASNGHRFHAGDTLLWPAAAKKRSAKAGSGGAAVLETVFPRHAGLQKNLAAGVHP